MLVVEPRNIAKYSQCPRRAQLSWNIARDETCDFETTVIKQVIQAAYLHIIRKGEVPTWRRIINWADLHYQRVSVDPTVSQPKEYKSAVSLLSCLYGWYHEQFLPSAKGIEPIINVPVYLELGHDVVYRDHIPMIIIGESITLVDFRQVVNTDVPAAAHMLYNDLTVHVRVWGFLRAAEQKPNNYTRIFIGPGSVKMTNIKITQEFLENAAKICKHILTGIKDRVFYPSFSEQCSRCPFKRNCSI